MMSTGIAPGSWQLLLEGFAAQHPRLSSQDGAAFECPVASSLFVAHLAEHGIAAAVVPVPVCDYPLHYGTTRALSAGGAAHVAVLVGGVIVDWTVRQFVSEAPFPLVFARM